MAASGRDDEWPTRSDGWGSASCVRRTGDVLLRSSTPTAGWARGRATHPLVRAPQRRGSRGERDRFADVAAELTGARRSSARSRLRCGECRAGEVVTYGELAALAGRPRRRARGRAFCAENRFAIVVPCHRVVAARRARRLRVARARLQAAAARARGRRAVSPFSEELRDELAGIAPRRDCDRLAELSGLFHAAGSAHLRGRGEICAPPRPRELGGRRGARSRSCASSASRPRSAPTAGTRSSRRRATSSTSRASSGRSRSCTRRACSTSGCAARAAAAGASSRARAAAPRICAGRCSAAARSAARAAPHLELRSGSARGRGVPRVASPRVWGSTLRVRRSRQPRDRLREGRRADRGRARRRGRLQCGARLRGARGDRGHDWRHANRLANADHANLVRTSRAAHAQLQAVRALEAAGVLDDLPERLREAGRLRLRHPTLSLRELAARCARPRRRPPCTAGSRSCGSWRRHEGWNRARLASY